MSNWSIKKRIGTGFTTVLILLTVVGLWSLRGLGEIVHNAEGVIDGNKLKAEMVQREVDHLQWATRVSELINDEHVHTLDVQTDPHKCGFGQWYYGEGRQRAEELEGEGQQASHRRPVQAHGVQADGVIELVSVEQLAAAGHPKAVRVVGVLDTQGNIADQFPG